MHTSPQGIRRLLLILILLATTIGCDQVTKAMARSSLTYQPMSYLGDVLRLQRSENTGAFLSTGAGLDNDSRFYIFTVAVAVFLAIVLFLLVKNKNQSTLNLVSWSLVIGGGVGNLIDRALKGSVTDFLNLGIGWLRTGIFNVADMVIVVGVVLLFFAGKSKSSNDSKVA